MARLEGLPGELAWLTFAKLHLNKYPLYYYFYPSYLVVMHNTTFGETPHTSCHAWWWNCDDLDLFCTHTTGHLAVMESTINASLYQSIVVEHEAV